MLSRFDSKQMMEAPGIPSTRWFDAAMLPKDQVKQKDNLKAMMVFGPRRQHRHPHAGSRQGPREARAAGRRRSASDHLGGARRAQERHLPAADLHPVRVRRARARPPTARSSGASRSSSRSSSRRTTTRSCTCWPRSSASPTGCSRTSRSRTTRPVAEDILREINRGGWSTGYCGQSPERLKAPHGEPEGLRPGHAAGQGRAGQGRLLRPAVAVLGHAGAQASRHPHALQHQPARDGRRRHLPRPLRRGARGQAARRHVAQGQPAGRGLLLARLGDQGRLPRVHLWGAQEARLGQGPDRRREGGHRAHRRQQPRRRVAGRPTSPAASSAWR